MAAAMVKDWLVTAMTKLNGKEACVTYVRWSFVFFLCVSRSISHFYLSSWCKGKFAGFCLAKQTLPISLSFTAICNNCVNGKCIAPGQCKCHPGWTGPNCDQCVPLSGCNVPTGGYCIDPNNSTIHVPNGCLCKHGFTGIFCDEPLCTPACIEGHGKCIFGTPSTQVCNLAIFSHFRFIGIFSHTHTYWIFFSIVRPNLQMRSWMGRQHLCGLHCLPWLSNCTSRQWYMHSPQPMHLPWYIKRPSLWHPE